MPAVAGRTPQCACWARAVDLARVDRGRGVLPRNLISREVWSVTSFSELAREAPDVERWNRLHPAEHGADESVARLPGR